MKIYKELLLHFDLSCCRVAVNCIEDVYVSAQCLASIIRGTYPLPQYVKNKDAFLHRVLKDKSYDYDVASSMYERISKRIAKYEERDFKPVWVDIDDILDWIKYRFDYAKGPSNTNSHKCLGPLDTKR